MARKKSNRILKTFSIFFTGLRTYFVYLDQCVKYLSFPIWGQIIGLTLLCTCSYYFNINADNIRNISPFFENDRNFLTIYWLILLPFLVIFIKAVYEYLIAFSALNLLFYTTSAKKRAKDINFHANNQVIERKLFSYVVLMTLVTLLLIIPPLTFIAPLIWVFICLSFQVFALEGDINPVGAISRSVDLVKGNIIPTIIMLLLCFGLTYWFLPSLFVWALEKVSFISFLMGKMEGFVNLIPFEPINNILSFVNFKLDTLIVSRNMAETLIIFVVIAYTLPLRCCCFTELYKLYDSEKIKDFSKQTDEIIVRATGRKRKN